MWDVYYARTPSNLTPTQLNNTPWESGRQVATILKTSPYDSAFSFAPSYQYADPHTIPYDTPMPSLGSLTTAIVIQGTIAYLNTTASTWVAEGSTFTFSADLSQIVSRFGAGVYTIQVYGGGIVSNIRVLFSYSIFVSEAPSRS